MRASDPAIDSPASIAARGKEIIGLDIFRRTSDDITPERVQELMAYMHSDVPSGGEDFLYGPSETHVLRFWKSGIKYPSDNDGMSPIIVFIHGGSWRAGTYLDSLGSKKVYHLTNQGYAFASVNYSLVPTVKVNDQVQEVASSIAYLVRNASTLGFDPRRIILMGHSSGAYVVALLGTDLKYLNRACVDIEAIKGIIALDGSNFNAAAEVLDSPGPIAQNMFAGLGRDVQHLRDMSPTYHARSPNAGAFLLLQAQRQGDIRQAVEFEAALLAAGTRAVVRVFEGDFFEGHIAMLLRLGEEGYPATAVVDEWLREYVPVE